MPHQLRRGEMRIPPHQKRLRLFEQLSPIYKWNPGGLITAQSSPWLTHAFHYIRRSKAGEARFAARGTRYESARLAV